MASTNQQINFPTLTFKDIWIQSIILEWKAVKRSNFTLKPILK
jgi:hypothetical protein